MYRVSSGSINPIYSTNVDFSKTTGRKIEKRSSRLSFSFVDKHKNISTSMSNSFSSNNRKTRRSSISFSRKFSTASNSQKQMELPTNKTENTEKAKNSQGVNQSSRAKTGDRLINGVIDELEKMGCPKGKIYVMRNGVSKKGFLQESFHHFDLNEKDKQRNYIRNVLVQMKFDRNEIDTTTYNKLKTESLGNVLKYFNMVPKMTKAEYCEDILKEIENFPRDIQNYASNALKEKLQQPDLTINQLDGLCMFVNEFGRQVNKIDWSSKGVTAMEVFNRQLKNF